MTDTTLLEKYAMAALTGFCANEKALKDFARPITKGGKVMPQAQLAFICFNIAQAMVDQGEEWEKKSQ